MSATHKAELERSTPSPRAWACNSAPAVASEFDSGEDRCIRELKCIRGGLGRPAPVRANVGAACGTLPSSRPISSNQLPRPNHKVRTGHPKKLLGLARRDHQAARRREGRACGEGLAPSCLRETFFVIVLRCAGLTSALRLAFLDCAFCCEAAFSVALALLLAGLAGALPRFEVVTLSRLTSLLKLLFAPPAVVS